MTASNQSVEVLLVEDNPHDAELALRALDRHHLANFIVHVSDGAEALDFLYARNAYAGRDKAKLPKVVLMDLKLPKVDGIEVLRTMKADPQLRTIPVVVLTTSREESDLKTSYQLGVNSYIVKPVDFPQFVESVRQLGLYWLLINEPPPH
jgi:two-component system, response regulator